jgi:hypothetical protein
MKTEDVLSAIDSAVGDWEVSPDASRQNASMSLQYSWDYGDHSAASQIMNSFNYIWSTYAWSGVVMNRPADLCVVTNTSLFDI